MRVNLRLTISAGQPKVGLLDDEESLGGSTLTGLGITKERAREWLVTALEQITVIKRLASLPDSGPDSGPASG